MGRGEGSRALVLSDGRAARSRPHRSGQPPPHDSVELLRHERLSRRPATGDHDVRSSYRSHVSPRVSQPMRTWPDRRSAIRLRILRPRLRRPRAHRPPEPWNSIGTLVRCTSSRPRRLSGRARGSPGPGRRFPPRRRQARRRARRPQLAAHRRAPRHARESVGFVEHARAHASRSVPSNARTAVRRSSGTRVGRRDSRSTRTRVWVAVTMSSSSGRRTAVHSYVTLKLPIRRTRTKGSSRSSKPVPARRTRPRVPA